MVKNRKTNDRASPLPTLGIMSKVIPSGSVAKAKRDAANVMIWAREQQAPAPGSRPRASAATAEPYDQPSSTAGSGTGAI